MIEARIYYVTEDGKKWWELQRQYRTMNGKSFKDMKRAARMVLDNHVICDQAYVGIYEDFMERGGFYMCRSGTMVVFSYHPGKMDAVMSICSIHRGGDLNAQGHRHPDPAADCRVPAPAACKEPAV